MLITDWLGTAETSEQSKAAQTNFSRAANTPIPLEGWLVLMIISCKISRGVELPQADLEVCGSSSAALEA